MLASPETVRPLPRGRQPRNPISGTRIEKIISRSVAVVAIVFAIQTVPWLLGQVDEAYPLWLWVVVPALSGSLVLVLVLSFLGIWVRKVHGAFAILFLAALISWPYAVIAGVAIFSGMHWLNYLITVATATAVIAFTARVATGYLVAVSLLYGVTRVAPQGGGAGWQLAVIETVYSLLLGAAIIIIVTMLRHAARRVDAAQATALQRYGLAVRQHATEVERVQVDSIVHDSVLTTLLSAARADTDEARSLAVTMAANAIGHLRDAAAAAPDGATTMRLAELALKIADSASQFPDAFRVRVRALGARSMPRPAADAVYSAAVQAMVNSSQHAGGKNVSRWVTIRGLTSDRVGGLVGELIEGGIEVVVGDSGAGFTVSEIPAGRLGLRTSVIERIANAGGHASVVTAPTKGAVVTIRWPDERGVSGARDPLFGADAGAP